MFNIFQPKPNKNPKNELVIKVGGMHCSSCAVNIDLTLEEVEGVVESKTNFAKSETHLTINPDHFSIENIVDSITKMGYKIDEISGLSNI